MLEEGLKLDTVGYKGTVVSKNIYGLDFSRLARGGLSKIQLKKYLFCNQIFKENWARYLC